MMERILIVEDERPQRDALARHLVRQDFEVEAVGTAEDALSHLGQARFAALITDLRLPGIDGLELVRRARDLDEEMPALIMTAYASVETAVEALRAGAHDYILKPLFFEELTRKLRVLLEHRELLRENQRLRAALRRDQDSDLIGVSAGIGKVREWIRRAAGTPSTVLITGETGTGKEVVAQAIHKLGPHADHPLLTINVAALPDNMVESELFGHERGAFTGAQRRRDGILRAVGKGTVFLDEIGELSPNVQAKLLRAMEAREFLPLGYDRPVEFEARILCATHRDLLGMVRDGTFREDLYYRLNVLHIDCPPLRERPEDIPPLAHHLIERHTRRTGTGAPVLSAEAIQALCRYSWPGNVRELSNVLERALILAEHGRIEPEHLPAELADREGGATLLLKEAVDRYARKHIAMVLRMCGGSRERAAAELGLSLATLYRRLERLDLKGDKSLHP